MEHFDVVIVGAGLSGIGAAFHLQERCPGKSYAILEGRDAIGGTWDLFRYPGIRSDSDMHTLGYSFKPWLEAKAIADGPSIRKYVNETADENEIRDNIRFNHLVQDAAWSTEHATWTVTSFNKATPPLLIKLCITITPDLLLHWLIRRLFLPLEPLKGLDKEDNQLHGHSVLNLVLHGDQPFLE